MIDPADLRDVFDRAASLAPADRAAFLDRVCREKVALRREVERLLAADARMGSVFEPRASGAASGTDIEPTRSFAAGTQLGPYVVEALVGAGGMGEVYRARDTRLARTVAIKVLPSALTRDPTARQRFEREARAAAALAHPHICRLLDIGREREVDFLVMEYLDGETLAARLERGKLPVGTALTLGLQIATALAAAHRAGIVHRDLKPGNIMLARDGAMLLDFGLARQLPVASTDGAVATIDNPITRTGMILGTVQYMAPEQLDGRESDARTDVFAFGVVLYEMVTGRRAFEGTTHATLIGNILHADPPSMSMAAPLVPPALDRLIRRCLAKDPEDRWPSMADVQARLEALQEVLRDGSGSGTVPDAREVVPSTRRRKWATPAAAVLLTCVVGASAWWAWRQRQSPPTEAPVRRTAVQRNLTRLTFDAGLQTDPAFSPDGRFIAYASDRGGNFDIWVQPLAGGDAIQVTKSPETDTQPSWSPDGSTIVFRSERNGGGLYLVPAFGGLERLLVNRGVYPSWSPDGREVRFLGERFVAHAATLFAVSPGGDAPHQVLPDFTAKGHWLWIAPRTDGRISFLGRHSTLGIGLFTVSADGRVTASKTPVLDSAKGVVFARFRWNDLGTAVCVEAGNGLTQELWLLRVDPDTLRIVSEERLTTSAASEVAAAFDPDGTHIIFSSQHVSERLWQYHLDAVNNRLDSGRPLTQVEAVIGAVSVSPDGKKFLHALLRPGERTTRTWLTEVDTGRSELFAENSTCGTWTNDGREVACVRQQIDPLDVSDGGASPTSVEVRSVDGRGRVASPWMKDPLLWPSSWLVDHNELLLTRQGGGHDDVVAWPVTDPPATAASRTVLTVPGASVWGARLSPNRRWLSFHVVSNDSLSSVVGITSADGPPDRPWRPVASTLAWVDRENWSADGRRLYFNGSRPKAFLNLMAVRFDPDTGTLVGEPFQITDFNSPAFQISPFVQRSTAEVRQDHAFLTMFSSTGNIWTIDNVER